MKMKQLFIGAAVAGLVCAVPSLARAEVSSDVVGYATMELEAGKWYLIGTPFSDCADGDIKLNDHLVSGFNQGDVLQIFNPGESKYKTYYFKTGLSGDQTSGWCTSAFSTTPADVTLDPGAAAFVNIKTATTVTVAGKVQLTKAFSFGAEGGNAWNQVVSPACSDTQLNDLVWTGLAAGDTIQLFVPDSSKYTTYYFKTGLGADQTVSGWCASAFSTKLADVTVKVGEAFFINKKSTGIGYVAAQ